MERKCAIYNLLSAGDDEQLKAKREEMIQYCLNVLHIENYEVFEEISSFLVERKQFNKMMEKIEQNDFTDVLLYKTDDIYKQIFNAEIYTFFWEQISSKAKIHNMKENDPKTIYMSELHSPNDKETVDITKVKHEPIISEECFNRAKKIIKEKCK